MSQFVFSIYSTPKAKKNILKINTKIITSTPTNNENFSTSMSKEEQQLFAFDGVIITACEGQSIGTTDVEPFLQLKSLQTRVSKALESSRGFTDLVSLAEAYEDDTKINIRLITTEHPMVQTSLTLWQQGLRRKMWQKSKLLLGCSMCLFLHFKQYQKVLNNVAAANIKTLYDTSLLMYQKGVDLNQTANQIKQMCKESVSKHAKTI